MAKKSKIDYTFQDLLNENSLSIKIGLLGEEAKRPSYYSMSKMRFTTLKNGTSFSDSPSPNSSTSLTAASELLYDMLPYLGLFLTVIGKGGDKVDAPAELLLPDRMTRSLFDVWDDALKAKLAGMKLKIMGSEMKEKKA